MLKDSQTITFSVLHTDLEHWLSEWLPFILVIYDAQDDTSYWLYVQAFFQQQAHFNLDLMGETVTLHIDCANVVDEEAIRRFACFKADILRQRPEDFRYEF